jgi:hypothetical protein
MFCLQSRIYIHILALNAGAVKISAGWCCSLSTGRQLFCNSYCKTAVAEQLVTVDNE